LIFIHEEIKRRSDPGILVIIQYRIFYIPSFSNQAVDLKVRDGLIWLRIGRK
jgi:hypothetical protein